MKLVDLFSSSTLEKHLPVHYALILRIMGD